MAFTSASSIRTSFKYDVFLSFRGEDVRKTFVDHLYLALAQKGIITYKDDEKIEKGERISDNLTKSIRESRIHVIIFSKNYASSSWCLDELVKIMECQKTKQQTTYPIFFDVEPTEVRHQSGAFGEAFAKHEKSSRSFVLPLAFCCSGSSSSLNGVTVDTENEEDAGRWRNSLKEAANLAGMELKTTFNGHEAKCIQQIVQEISLKLHLINSSADEMLVGMETRVKKVVSSLNIASDDVLMIGIKGIGGGGKTTLARAVFDHISVWFEGASFVENVREVSKGSSSGLKELQKQVLHNVLNDQSINVTSVSEGKSKMKKMMCSRKVLVVLDDVDDTEQLEALAGELTWFHPGSKIIITTRDQQVLVAHRVNFIHDVNLLSREEAVCLFSRYAFKSEIPNQGYEKLSREVVRYAAGLPLTIKVLGSHLCGRSEQEWADAIKRLKTIPLEKTLKRLEISYDGLETDQKEIFLDVVCMLKGEKKDRAIRILESCGLNAHIGLSVLEQKSLITISNEDRLGFHDHIEELGRNIVRRFHPNEPRKHSRLWIEEEIEDILVNESGTEATRCMKLDFARVDPKTIINGLKKMKEIRLLLVDDTETKVDEVSQYLPDSLQSLCWFRYPFQSLPGTFQANKLVNLEMCESNIFELWEGRERKVFNKLKFLELSYSKLRSFDLSMTPHLEVLNLQGCRDFVELHMPVECPNLKVLNLSISKVSQLNLGLTPHLEVLYLERCSYLQEVQAPVGSLKKLAYCELESCLSFAYFKVEKRHESDLDSVATLEVTAICVEVCPLHPKNKLPWFEFTCKYNEPRSSWSGNLENFFRFGSCVCENLEYFLATLCGLQNSRELKLDGSISQDVWRLVSLEKLSLRNQQFQHLSDSLFMLKHLKSLELDSCLALKQLPENICILKYLEDLVIWGCDSLLDIPNNICNLKCLKHLELSYCRSITKLPEEFGSLERLKELGIGGTGISRLPESIYQLKGLRISGYREQLQSYGFTWLMEDKFSMYTYVKL